MEQDSRWWGGGIASAKCEAHKARLYWEPEWEGVPRGIGQWEDWAWVWRALNARPPCIWTWGSGHSGAMEVLYTGRWPHQIGLLERLLQKLGRGGMEEDARSWSLVWTLVTVIYGHLKLSFSWYCWVIWQITGNSWALMAYPGTALPPHAQFSHSQG